MGVSSERYDGLMSSVCSSQLGRLIYPAHILVDTPTCDVRKGRFSKRLVTAHNTHTWWFNMGPFKLRDPNRDDDLSGPHEHLSTLDLESQGLRRHTEVKRFCCTVSASTEGPGSLTLHSHYLHLSTENGFLTYPCVSRVVLQRRFHWTVILRIVA